MAVEIFCQFFYSSEIKKTAPEKSGTVSLKKIVVSLAESVYRFHEPVVFFDVDVCDKQTHHRDQREKRLNTFLRKINSSR